LRAEERVLGVFAGEVGVGGAVGHVRSLVTTSLSILGLLLHRA
jgi:hypothetical protein